MASNTPTASAPLSSAEVEGMLAMLVQGLDTIEAATSKLSEKLEKGLIQGLMAQDRSEEVLQRQLDDSAMEVATLQRRLQDLDRDQCVTKMRVTKLEEKSAKLEEKYAKLERKSAKLEADLPTTYLKLLNKLGKLEHRIADMEEARHVEQHERSSKGAGNV
ncbi:hypothetical protein HBI56_131610 [Parastagonospora nodorum]|uniref:Uncharacterized protein n=2 Tax=Phaeosphaeria nodorum (strain SN15 / ATCC MYA-4574 / FGSC 10173) TaxID=321614 RepID=A0A7U2F1W4_PHANO|nr:hypothetical protein SNOG_05745 [Parastagonospora nodorum SN15]KAH3909780.1 hypothetical protein HBH56_152200 [Parastagonospora nodorum]EAT86809.2 hypothetical protein SNOG_05745 [Parastagonospora nodorum SN15]KAH3926525.1 hypothetical protein HBH54_165480 [Parastagonospora nodorum]KAH3970222.1 hypothetical protein HBH52_165390 [Parastagonospora nodorum]KAH3971881.1 hypothetical protein HBH51_107790 [Parastagonospora nodorum]